MKIEKNTTLAEIVEKKGAEEVLHKNGVPCVTCPMAQMEMKTLKIGDVCGMYGIDFDKLKKDLEKI